MKLFRPSQGRSTSESKPLLLFSPSAVAGEGGGRKIFSPASERAPGGPENPTCHVCVFYFC
jgi:hypothetical protein